MVYHINVWPPSAWRDTFLEVNLVEGSLRSTDAGVWPYRRHDSGASKDAKYVHVVK
jgi:hypothetical protein